MIPQNVRSLDGISESDIYYYLFVTNRGLQLISGILLSVPDGAMKIY